MLINFFQILRAYGVPVSLRELLDLLRAMEKGVVFANMDDFYQLSRMSMVKDERWYDRFDRAFAHYFHDIQSQPISGMVSEEWLRANLLRGISEEDREKLKKYKDMDELLSELKKRLEEQEKRHEGGNRWIGTGGTSAFGNSGYHPEGIRIGGKSEQRRAVKTWEQRQYRGLDGDTRLGIRNTQMALRRLRRFARQGREEELDMGGTIRATARDGGLLNVRMMPPRRNAIKVLLFLDVGGSMDPHIKVCEELFSAARLEFKQLKYFYFHNFIYESVWENDRLSYHDVTPVEEITRKYGSDYKLIFVGDAAMSPYEIFENGTIQNESGSLYSDDRLSFLRTHYRRSAWLNPMPRDHWDSTASVAMIRELMEDKMYPMSLHGIEKCVSELSN
jgi:uncharacterized protein with von Willebrand factor type A (vWA) domain